MNRRSTNQLLIILLAGCFVGCVRIAIDDDARSGSSSRPVVRAVVREARPLVRMASDPANPEHRYFTVTDLPAEFLNDAITSNPNWSEIFPVRIKSDSETQLPPIAGSYQLRGTTLEFHPMFPLSEGLTYEATFEPMPHVPTLRGVFTVPKSVTEPTTSVTQIFPSSDTLPENLLKLYVHFSAPVRQGRSYEYVRLLDANGEVMEASILKLDQELWNPEGTRLTLLLDPGRIKQGLVPNQELGQILEAGKTYTLFIDQNWPDRKGNPLVSEVRKTFTASAADHESPSQETWKLSLPQPGTRDTLHVTFNEPMDEAILQHALWVEDPQGQTVSGPVQITGEETIWTLTPQVEWELGVYQLVAHHSLEDRSGNSLGRPFETMENDTPAEIPEVFKRALIIGN